MMRRNRHLMEDSVSRQHTITEAEMDEWLRTPQWRLFAGSFTQYSNKRLEIDCSGDGRVFRVTDHGETVFIGADRAAAIAAYNNSR